MKIRWQTAQFFEARWWRSYLRKHPVQGYLEWKKEYWETFLQKEKIKVLSTDKILDAGCGPAGVFMMFPENKVLAIDPLLDFYRMKIPHFKEQSFKKTEFKKLTIEQLEVENSFEKIFCLNAINHVSDLEKCVKNLCSALTKNGVFYLSIDAHNFVLLKNIFRWIPGDILHPQQLDLQGYKSLLENHGLDILQTSLIKQGFIFNYYLLRAVKK